MSDRHAQHTFVGAVLADVAADFGTVETAAIMGPTAAHMARAVFDHLSVCAGEATKRTAEGILVARGGPKLKRWLVAPDETDLRGVLTIQGSIDVLSLVAQLGAESKLPQAGVRKIAARIASRLFAGDRDGDTCPPNYSNRRPKGERSPLHERCEVTCGSVFVTGPTPGQLMH